MIFWPLKCRKNIVCFIDSEFLICYNSLIEQKERRDNIDNAKGRRTAEQGINGNIDNAKELPVESQNLLLILARGMVFTRNCMMRQNAADQPRMPPDEHSA